MPLYSFMMAFVCSGARLADLFHNLEDVKFLKHQGKQSEVIVVQSSEVGFRLSAELHQHDLGQKII